jgi:protein-tyrosine phosphatase
MDISRQSARQVRRADFAKFDLVLAMDRSNYQDLMQLAPQKAKAKVRLFLDYAPHADTMDVPDPFYGGTEGFDHALDLIEEASRGLLEQLFEHEATKVKKGAQASRS